MCKLIQVNFYLFIVLNIKHPMSHKILAHEAQIDMLVLLMGVSAFAPGVGFDNL